MNPFISAASSSRKSKCSKAMAGRRVTRFNSVCRFASKKAANLGAVPGLFLLAVSENSVYGQPDQTIFSLCW